MEGHKFWRKENPQNLFELFHGFAGKTVSSNSATIVSPRPLLMPIILLSIWATFARNSANDRDLCELLFAQFCETLFSWDMPDSLRINHENGTALIEILDMVPVHFPTKIIFQVVSGIPLSFAVKDNTVILYYLCLQFISTLPYKIPLAALFFYAFTV